ncbi:MAG: hypothetical protein WC050_01710 [Candidatus Paceibacterota bacterium]
MTLKHIAAVSIFMLVLGGLPTLASADSTIDGKCVKDDGTSTDGACPGDAVSSNLAFQRQGVFGCSQTGSYAMSVGALSAVGGTYVPVNDAAVTLNTGYLVYKECVLRGIVNRMREDQTAGLLKKITVAYSNGRNGQPMFVQSLPKESRAVYTSSVSRDIQGDTLSPLNPAFQTAAKRAIVEGYMAGINAPNRSLGCRYQGDLYQLQTQPTKASGNIWAGLNAMAYPSCNPFFAVQAAKDLVMGNAASLWNDQLTQVGWGNGNYPRQVYDADGNLITVTPGYLIGATEQQALETGFAQLQNANDIDQMVGALFSGITSQVISDSRGLAGLTQNNGNQMSYLDQVIKESASGLRNSALNAAIQIVAAAKSNELTYFNAMNDIGTILVNTIKTLRANEQTCWDKIITAVCADTVKADNTCTGKAGPCTTDPTTGELVCPVGPKLKVATSTAFSQGVITNSIAPLASSTALNIEASKRALAVVDRLLKTIVSGTVVEQRDALLEVDGLVTNRGFRSQYDAENAKQSKTDVTGNMITRLQDTNTLWGDKELSQSDPSSGWCNVNLPSVIQMWTSKWKI